MLPAHFDDVTDDNITIEESNFVKISTGVP